MAGKTGFFAERHSLASLSPASTQLRSPCQTFQDPTLGLPCDHNNTSKTVSVSAVVGKLQSSYPDAVKQLLAGCWHSVSAKTSGITSNL